MSPALVRDFSTAAWSEVYNRIIGAVVFLDDASAECLHWDGGLFNLLDGGAVAVKSLSPFESCTSEHRKAVFISQATSTQLNTIKMIVRNSDFTHCILVSAVSLDVVYLELNDGRDVSDVVSAGKAPAEAMKLLEGMMLEWIGKQQSAVEVIHIPITTISVTDDIFLMPPVSQVYPSYGGKLIPDTPSIDLYTLSNSERSQVRRLASALNSMLDSLNLREEVFFMGTYSSLVAGILDNSPVCLARRKRCRGAASLILVDRTLDLCGVSSHAARCSLDKLAAALPRLPGHCADRAVDCSPLVQADVAPGAHPALAPGCLYHGAATGPALELMVRAAPAELCRVLHDRLAAVSAAPRPHSPHSPQRPQSPARVTVQALDKLLAACKGNYPLIEKHSSLLQHALAVVQSLKSGAHAQVELTANFERQARQNIAASRASTSVLRQMSMLIQSRRDRNLPLERLVALLVHIYSLVGTGVTFTPEHERDLEASISKAVFEDHKDSVGDSPEGCGWTQQRADEVAQTILARLKEVSQMRRILKKFPSVLLPTSSGTDEYRSVLQQLMSRLTDPARPDAGDLARCERRDLFSMLSKKPRAHPLDPPVVIVFIIGGVSGDECAQILRLAGHTRDTAGETRDSAGQTRDRAGQRVLVASTKLVSPVEAAADVLCPGRDADRGFFDI